MPVFNAYFKILKQQILAIMIYVAIFIVISLAFTSSSGTRDSIVFLDTKVPIVFISEDEPSELIEGLKTYLKDYVEFIDIADQDEKLQDALFFREVEYILRVPNGFSKKFEAGEEVKIQSSAIEGGFTKAYIGPLVDDYFTAARIYIEEADGKVSYKLIDELVVDLALDTKVQLEEHTTSTGKMNVYIKANEIIATTEQVMSRTNKLYEYIGIEFGFCIVFVMLGLGLSKQRRKSY